MNDYCQRFYFAKDMNGDFVFTVTDVWLIIKTAFLLPAKTVMIVVDNQPGITTFLESGCSTGDSWGGGIFSMFAWVIVLGLVGLALDR